MAIYGVQFNGTSSAGTRTDDAVGLVWQRSTNTVAGQDDFASLAPFNVRECVTKYNSSLGKREVLGYKGDTGYSTLRSNTANDIMIEFPIFWYQRPSRGSWRVSDRPIAGFKPSPMHYHKGKLYKYVRVSKYAVNSSYISQTGSTPRTNTNINTFRTNLRNKGMYVFDYPTYCSISMLNLIKYANTNLQGTVGRGVNNIPSSGLADSVLGLDGSTVAVGSAGSIVSSGIENLYGNVWKQLDGIYASGNYLYYKDILDMSSDPSSAADLTTNYIKINTSFIPGAYNTAVNNIAFSSDYDFGIFPVSGSDFQGANCDACYTGSGFLMIKAGGCYADADCGIFTLLIYNEVGNGNQYGGAMAIELSDPIPQKQLYIKDNNEVYAMMQPQ